MSGLEQMHEHLAKLEQENKELRAAMQRFVDKVDQGYARSHKTYNEFKGAAKCSKSLNS